jgi:hypothetical protein
MTLVSQDLIKVRLTAHMALEVVRMVLKKLTAKKGSTSDLEDAWSREKQARFGSEQRRVIAARYDKNSRG